jgi:hypothetical protein
MLFYYPRTAGRRGDAKIGVQLGHFAQQTETRVGFFDFFPCNSLKSPDSDE